MKTVSHAGGVGLVREHLSRIIKYCCAGLVLTLVVIVFVQVTFRFVFQHPFTWAEEAARYFFIWASFLGVVLGIEKKAHFSMDFIAKGLKHENQKILDMALRVIVGFFLVLLTYYSVELTMVADSQFSPALNLPLSYLFAIMPFSFAAMCFFLIFSGIISDFKGDV